MSANESWVDMPTQMAEFVAMDREKDADGYTLFVQRVRLYDDPDILKRIEEKLDKLISYHRLPKAT